MWKKILASFFLGASILSISSIGYANQVTNRPLSTIKIEKEVDISKYEVINPERNSYSTEDKIVFINGKAPSGTTIVIRVYGTMDLTRKNFDLLKLPNEEDYIEVFEDTVSSGNLGFFDKQLELVTGINKIVVDFGIEGVPSVEIIVYIKTPEDVKNTKDVKLTNILQQILK